MFAIRNTFQRNLNHVGRKLASSTPTIPKQPIPEMYQSSTFKKNFLSDPGTYPLIIVLGTAMCFIVGMSANAFLHYKDLRINPENKHKVIQDWGYERRVPVAHQLAEQPIGYNAKAFYDIRNEGLGVNHEEWLKNKQKEHEEV